MNSRRIKMKGFIKMSKNFLIKYNILLDIEQVKLSFTDIVSILLLTFENTKNLAQKTLPNPEILQLSMFGANSPLEDYSLTFMQLLEII